MNTRKIVMMSKKLRKNETIYLWYDRQNKELHYAVYHNSESAKIREWMNLDRKSFYKGSISSPCKGKDIEPIKWNGFDF